jgi:hypothetical protein
VYIGDGPTFLSASLSERLVRKLVEKLAGWRGVLALALTVLMAGLLALTMSDIADAKKRNVDFAKGKGVDDTGSEFRFTAKNNSKDSSTDDSAKGKFFMKQGGEFFKGKVICLQAINEEPVSKGAADIVFEVKKSSVPEAVGTSMGVDVWDSGLPDGEGDIINNRGPATECIPPVASKSTSITSGDIVVEASTTVP